MTRPMELPAASTADGSNGTPKRLQAFSIIIKNSAISARLLQILDAGD